MRGMQKIYKRGLVENRAALACIAFASLATTFLVALVLLGAVSYWPIALIVAISLAGAVSAFSRPYEMDTGSGSVIALLILNFFILCVCFLLL